MRYGSVSERALEGAAQWVAAPVTRVIVVVESVEFGLLVRLDFVLAEVVFRLRLFVCLSHTVLECNWRAENGGSAARPACRPPHAEGGNAERAGSRRPFPIDLSEVYCAGM